MQRLKNYLHIMQNLSTKDFPIWLWLFCVFACYLIVMVTLFNIPPRNIAKYVGLIIFSIFLPGLAILSYIQVELSRFGYFCIAYLLGYVVVVISFFLSELFNREISFTAVACIVSIFSMLILWRFHNRNEKWISNAADHDCVDLFFFTLFLLFNIFAYAARYLGTDVVPIANIYGSNVDMQFWANNTVALKLSWPANALFMSGYPLNYHYFSSIPIAFFSSVYEIDVFTLSFPLYVFTRAIIMVGAMRFLLDFVQANREQSLLGYILILCTAGAEQVCAAAYVHHTLLCPFGFDVGYAYGIIFTVFLVRQWQSDSFRDDLFVGTLLSWGMCVGSKGSVAAVLLAFVSLICLYWFAKRQWKLVFGYGFSILGLFFLISTYCVGIFVVAKGDALWGIGLHSTSEIQKMLSPEAWDVIGKAMVFGGSKNVIMAVLFRIFNVNPAAIFSVMLSTAAMIRWRQLACVSFQEVYLFVILGLTALWGLGLGVFVKVTGTGEMYFSMAAMIPMAVMIIVCLKRYQFSPLQIEKDSLGYKCLLVVCCCFVCLGVYRYCFSSRGGAGAIRASWQGAVNLYHAARGYDYSGIVKNGVRKKDVEALNWLRDYAETDALVMSDKAVVTNNPKYFLYGIFSERQQYLEGAAGVGTSRKCINEEVARRKAIISNVYQNKNGAIQTAIREGIDYIVQTTDITPEFGYDNDWLELVKSTETMNIYRVKRK